MKKIVKIEGLDCPNCAKTLEIEFLYRDNTSLDQQSLTGEYSGATVYAYYEDYDGTASGFD